MAEMRVDGRIDNYTISQDSWAETRVGTVLAGVKLGNRGADLSIGEAIRAQVVFNGKHSDPFNVTIKAQVIGVDRRPLILLEESERGVAKQRHYLVPQVAIGRKKSLSLTFSAKPKEERVKFELKGPVEREAEQEGIPLSEIKSGQVLLGANERGQRRRFLVAATDENNRPILETLDRNPQRIKPKFTGKNLTHAGKFGIDRVVADLRNVVAANRLVQEPS